MRSTSSGGCSFASLGTGAVSINRTCRGGGIMPYLLAGYLAVQGTLAHTCKRINSLPRSTHPLMPAAFFVGLVGSHAHWTVRMTLVSSCTLKTPAYLGNPFIVGCPTDDMVPQPRIKHHASALRCSVTTDRSLECLHIYDRLYDRHIMMSIYM